MEAFAKKQAQHLIKLWHVNVKMDLLALAVKLEIQQQL